MIFNSDFCISGGWLQIVNSAYKCNCRIVFDLMSPPATFLVTGIQYST